MTGRERLLRRQGRQLVARHSLFEALSDELYFAGVRCSCCPGFWRFQPHSRPDVRERRFHYLWKRYPRRMKQESDRELQRFLETGLEDENWWERMLIKYGVNS